MPVGKGLEGIVVGTTALSLVEGEVGRLSYVGYDIHELTRTATYEDVAHLLWMGKLPDAGQRQALRERLSAQRGLSPAVLDLLGRIDRRAEPMDVLRVAMAWIGIELGGLRRPDLDQAIALTAKAPTIITAFHRLRRKETPVPPDPGLSHAENYLWMLTGKKPEPGAARALDTYLILLADHGMNASTFVARIVASTNSDMASAVVSALGALKGPAHGGAPALVMDMLEAVQKDGDPERWVREALARGQRLMGFGHRAYKAEDPRAEVLRELSKRTASAEVFERARKLEEIALAALAREKPGRRLYTNVEYYSAVLLNAVDLPRDLFTPSFAVGRMAGYTAHVLEQVKDNRLIRPDVEYVGPMPQRASATPGS
jgi:citrate synthase